ncbi:hypothetical protein BKA59DRAFT_491452 [Fusarium tricinctum]|uniref:Cellobiose dehydrogenase n=1 Tax=Fusarium tricinctum TaxID=61284 RepID=A0A8K0S815_9HYPO|nr:hypothetical protein BKA59DRAFT_491452 [Fusarium tricinctum]
MLLVSLTDVAIASIHIKFRWAVPDSAVDSGLGNVYFQLDAPDTYAWVSLGIGGWMRDAAIVVMFKDGEGNVTLSTRDGRHHVMPEYVERSNIQLLEGSGVRDGRMVANVQCSGCQNLDLASQNSWIAAWSRGYPLSSTEPASNIGIHEAKTIMNVDFAQARIPSDRNPFLRAVGNSHVVELDTRDAEYDAVLIAHGVIMTTVFVALYPLGALLMPLLRWWFLHSTSQIFSWLLMWVGFCLGVVYANHIGILGKQTHTQLGLAIVTLLSIQPVLGWIHHHRYTKNEGRGVIKHIHVWYGRVLMILGIVNGGFGLKLAGQTSEIWIIAYGVVAGVLIMAYIGSIAYMLIVAPRRMGRGDYARPSPGELS